MYRMKWFCYENHSIVEDQLIFMLKTRSEAFTEFMESKRRNIL